MRVVVVALDGRLTNYKEDVLRSARKALTFLDERDAEVEIYLVNETCMRKLNRRFRGEDSATNVLAFPRPKEFPQSRCIGEVYLCPPYIRKQREDFLFLLIHGILHLLGFSHRGVRDTMEMERTEQKLVASIRGESRRLLRGSASFRCM